MYFLTYSTKISIRTLNEYSKDGCKVTGLGSQKRDELFSSDFLLHKNETYLLSFILSLTILVEKNGV